MSNASLAVSTTPDCSCTRNSSVTGGCQAGGSRRPNGRRDRITQLSVSTLIAVSVAPNVSTSAACSWHMTATEPPADVTHELMVSVPVSACATGLPENTWELPTQQSICEPVSASWFWYLTWAERRYVPAGRSSVTIGMVPASLTRLVDEAWYALTDPAAGSVAQSTCPSLPIPDTYLPAPQLSPLITT